MKFDLSREHPDFNVSMEVLLCLAGSAEPVAVKDIRADLGIYGKTLSYALKELASVGIVVNVLDGNDSLIVHSRCKAQAVDEAERYLERVYGQQSAAV